ncbi:tetratricopeptide repeat protein [Geitlerinema sp. CS-897]|nr:tetratricopeptide repeat protein [Geitlerinema sp. CS-897]
MMRRIGVLAIVAAIAAGMGIEAKVALARFGTRPTGSDGNERGSTAGETDAIARRRSPEALVTEGERLVMRGEVIEAISLYEEAQALHTFFSVGAQSWNILCWYGSLWGHAEEVLEACEQAVKLDPDNVEIRDSRGLARALVGDTDGAIEDFQAFVDASENEPRRFQRQNWIEMLQAGENPFTPDVLRMLFID